MKVTILFLAAIITLSSCTQNERVKRFGGSATIDIPADRQNAHKLAIHSELRREMRLVPARFAFDLPAQLENLRLAMLHDLLETLIPQQSISAAQVIHRIQLRKHLTRHGAAGLVVNRRSLGIGVKITLIKIKSLN